MKPIEFDGIPSGDGECFCWLIPRDQYEAMGLDVHVHEPDQDDADELDLLDAGWTDPTIVDIDGVEYVQFYPIDLLKAVGVDSLDADEYRKRRRFRFQLLDETSTDRSPGND